MTAQQELAKKAFQEAARMCAETGINVVACLAAYDKVDVDFTTILELKENDSLGLDADHIVLDCIREVSNEWSDMVHGKGNG